MGKETISCPVCKEELGVPDIAMISRKISEIIIENGELKIITPVQCRDCGNDFKVRSRDLSIHSN